MLLYPAANTILDNLIDHPDSRRPFQEAAADGPWPAGQIASPAGGAGGERPSRPPGRRPGGAAGSPAGRALRGPRPTHGRPAGFDVMWSDSRRASSALARIGPGATRTPLVLAIGPRRLPERRVHHAHLLSP